MIMNLMTRPTYLYSFGFWENLRNRWYFQQKNNYERT
jgi:hypothetical protein